MTEEVVRKLTVQVRHQRSVPFCTQRSSAQASADWPLGRWLPKSSLLGLFEHQDTKLFLITRYLTP
jgi:hypothetical protein